MNNHNLSNRLAVCSWSLQPSSPQDLIAKLKATGIKRLQLALDPLRENPAAWGSAPEVLAAAGTSIVSGMFGCLGEDYSTLDSIRLTGGIAPDETWAENRRIISATVALARQLGLKLVTFHAGFLPHDDSDPDFAKMLSRIREVADAFGAAGIKLGLETGQETAPALRHLLEKLDKRNVVVNFDPANMLLYDKGDPIEAVKVLGRWIGQVHIKDALRTKVPGTWGQEVPASTGEVNWRGFFSALGAQGFAGDLVIEREAGSQRVTDIIRARDLVRNIDV